MIPFAGAAIAGAVVLALFLALTGGDGALTGPGKPAAAAAKTFTAPDGSYARDPDPAGGAHRRRRRRRLRRDPQDLVRGDARRDVEGGRAPEGHKGETTRAVDGHDYVEITSGPRNGMFINTSDDGRRGEAFVRIRKGDHDLHVYGTGKDRRVIISWHKDEPAKAEPATGGADEPAKAEPATGGADEPAKAQPPGGGTAAPQL